MLVTVAGSQLWVGGPVVFDNWLGEALKWLAGTQVVLLGLSSSGLTDTPVYMLADWRTHWFADWRTNRRTGWLAEGLTDSPTGWLIYWLKDWLTGWLTMCQEAKLSHMFSSTPHFSWGTQPRPFAVFTVWSPAVGVQPRFISTLGLKRLSYGRH